MTPVEITQGKSFKGLATYLLHDQKREGEPSRDTTERVGWVQSYNLGEADGDQSWRLMLATANSANALKEAAGIKKGKAVKNTVYHYSINFNPEDKLTEDIQRRAVAGSLKALGLDDHQALAVEHTDKAHNHIHVMVNLIDPANGMSAASPQMCDDGKKRSKLSNSQRKLSSWAAKFERNNGLTITEGRLANANSRAQGELVNAKRKPRNVHEREKVEQTTDRRRDFMKRQHDDRAKSIQDTSARLKLQGQIGWHALKTTYQMEKTAIKAAMPAAFKRQSAETKERYKPQWAELFKRHEHERRAFDGNDRTAIGKIWHGAAVFRELALDGDYLGGFVAAFSAEARRNIILNKHDRDRERLGQKVQAEIAAYHKQIKADFDRQFTQARERFLAKCDRLKSSQREQWTEVRTAWRDYNSTRTAAFARGKTQQTSVSRDLGQGRGRGRSPS